jgi:hypothetical protein
MHAVVAIGVAGQRAGLVDDADTGFRSPVHAHDVIETILTCSCNCIAHSTAVWAWNSPKADLKRTFSIT